MEEAQQPDHVTGARPGLRLLTMAFGLVLAASAVFIGLRVGQTYLGEGPIEGLGGELRELQTTNGTYVGRLTDVRNGYVILAAPAVVTAQATADGATTEFVVEALAVEPYGLAGAIAIREEQIVHAASVAPDSGLAGAYRAATTDQSEPDTDP